jgi:hypothetical protein
MLLSSTKTCLRVSFVGIAVRDINKLRVSERLILNWKPIKDESRDSSVEYFVSIIDVSFIDE